MFSVKVFLVQKNMFHMIIILQKLRDNTPWLLHTAECLHRCNNSYIIVGGVALINRSHDHAPTLETQLMGRFQVNYRLYILFFNDLC